jgi:hypothetical protein
MVKRNDEFTIIVPKMAEAGIGVFLTKCGKRERKFGEMSVPSPELAGHDRGVYMVNESQVTA